MSYTVGELARITGVSIRTLHHYDEIGLLKPSDRTAAGYRVYSTADAERLHRILVYRELDFDLKRIAMILDQPGMDELKQLRQQHALLREQAARLQHILNTVEAMMKAKETGYNLTSEEMKEVFEGFDPRKHEAEAEERWGNTDAYRQSKQKAASYDKQQWIVIKEEAARISNDFAAALQQGIAADDERAMDLAEQHRRHISRWFYDCGYEMHSGLGEMYVADPRFTATYDAVAPGLAVYIRDAIRANAARA